jgi:hypothetical protein
MRVGGLLQAGMVEEGFANEAFTFSIYRNATLG